MKVIAKENNMFIPITKIDSKKRLVYGTITEEIPDKSGEIFDYATGKIAIQEWSDSFHKTTNGKSLGNVRVMHGSIAAGKFTDIVYEDEKKRIDAVAKIVDDAEWKKVEEGVYSGFSIGGGYKKRWADPTNPNLKRFTPEISEVSLVDNPCVPTATFEFIKQDGSVELRKFNNNFKEDLMKINITADKLEKMLTANVLDTDYLEKSISDFDVSTLSVGEVNAFTALVKTATDKEEEKKKLADEKKKEAKKVDEDPEDKDKKADDKKDEKKEAKKADDADELTKAARAEGSQVWKSNLTGEIFETKAAMVQHNIEAMAKKQTAPVEDLLSKINDELSKKEGKTDDDKKDEKKETKKANEKDDKKKENKSSEDKKDDKKDDANDDSKKAKKADDKKDLKKGLYDVAEFARVLGSLNYVRNSAACEAKNEGDNSSVPAMIEQGLKGLGAALVAMAQEEVSELFAKDEVQVEIMAMAVHNPEGTIALGKFLKDNNETLQKSVDKDKLTKFAEQLETIGNDELQKAGAKFSAATKEAMVGIHKSAKDHFEAIEKCYKDAGIFSDEKDKGKDDKAEKLYKGLYETEKQSKDVLIKQVDGLSEQLQKVLLRISNLESQPAPAKGVVRVVTKSADGSGDGQAPDLDKLQSDLAKLSPEERNIQMFKAALSNPVGIVQ